MTLQVVLDCDESFKKKAAYTFRTFAEVMGLNCDFRQTGEISPQDPIIWYGSQPPNARTPTVFIKASQEVAAFFKEQKSFDISRAKKFRWRDQDSIALFHDDVFERNTENLSTVDGQLLSIHVDLVASAFFFLSCWQEITSTERDIHGRFPASASLQYKLGLLHTPVVNQYIDMLRTGLEKLLSKRLEPGQRFSGKDFAVCLTHDIDYIRKWSLGIVYRELIEYFLLGKRDRSFNARFSRFAAFLRAISRQKDPYITSLQRIIDIEKSANVHATYFLKTGVSSKHDVSYRIGNGYVSRLLKELQARGHEIGLHPSYNTYLDARRMKSEKALLDELLTKKSVAVRQHFLRFRVPDTWRIQRDQNFLYDVSLGFSAHEGFRAGICHPFRPYDAMRDEVLDLWEIPLVAMDGTFQSYRNMSADEADEAIKSLIRTAKKHRGVAVLLFHNTCYDDLDNPGWGGVFERTIRFAIEEGAFVGSGQEILHSYVHSLTAYNSS